MRKLKLLYLPGSFLLALFVFNSCMKGNTCNAKTVASEEAAMQSFMGSIGMTGTQHSSGLYYEIVNPGSGPRPDFNNISSVKYTGKLTNGNVFDSRTAAPVNIQLGGVIPGWQIGLPLIAKGGLIKLVIPSSLGYACQSVGSVPSHAILYFEVELVDVF
jgi:FKBP-type peptidyl-prolyl cis-trans isomerase FkpA